MEWRWLFQVRCKEKNKCKGKKAGTLQRTDQSSAKRGMRKLKRAKQEGPCKSELHPKSLGEP